MANHFDQIGNPGEATPLFEKALERDPQLPTARVGVAYRKIHLKDLDGARDLLRFLERPGAGKVHSLQPLEYLATTLQQAGRHKEALEIFQHLIAEVPEVANDYQFRKLVSTSEKAVAKTTGQIEQRVERVLPSSQRSLMGVFNSKNSAYAPWERWTAWGTVAAIAITMISLFSNEYVRTHRVVTIIHDAQTPVSVSIDGGPEVPARRMSKLTLSEGMHRAKFTGAINDEVEFPVQSTFFQRFSNSPAWVLNPGCSSALCLETIHYAVNPRANEIEVFVGEPATYFAHVDYLFTEPPATLRLEKGSIEVTKTHLKTLTESPLLIISHVAKNGQMSKLVPYIEAQLKLSPDSSELHMWYLALCACSSQQYAIAQWRSSKIESGSDPFRWFGIAAIRASFSWTRAMLNWPRSTTRNCKKEPGNPALLYLRGRVSPNRHETESFMERAKAADPNLAWPWFASAFRAASDGDWKAALTSVEKARELKLADADLEQVRHTIRLGADDLAKLEAEYRGRLQSHHADPKLNDLSQLCEVLVAEQKPDLVMPEMESWIARMQPDQRDNAVLSHHVRQRIKFIHGVPGAAEQKNWTPIPMPNRQFVCIVLATLNRPSDATNDPKLAETLKDPDNALALSLAFSLADQTAEADTWRETAAGMLEDGDRDSQRIASLLRDSSPPTAEEIRELVTHPERKGLLLAVHWLSDFPNRNRYFPELARRLNVGRPMTYYLVKKAVEKS